MRILYLFVFFLCLTSQTAVFARTWHVPTDAPTIQAGVDSASAGDDVLVAPGIYPEHDIVMKARIWLHTESGPGATMVDTEGLGRGFVCVGIDVETIIEGFTIANGFADGYENGGGLSSVESRLILRDCRIETCRANVGGGIYLEASNAQLERCQIRDCLAQAGGGIWAYPATLSLTECVLLENITYVGAGGIYARETDLAVDRSIIFGNVAGFQFGGGILCVQCPQIMIRECLVAHNTSSEWSGASGIHIGHSFGQIRGCTVVGNRGWHPEDPAIAISESAEVEIARTIIAFNQGSALECEDSQVAVHCSDSYGNTYGDELCGDDLGGNISADPLFCDQELGDYTLDTNSPCLPGNHPDGSDCGLIGALEEGCGATSVQEATWGRIKAGYR